MVSSGTHTCGTRRHIHINKNESKKSPIKIIKKIDSHHGFIVAQIRNQIQGCLAVVDLIQTWSPWPCRRDEATALLTSVVSVPSPTAAERTQGPGHAGQQSSAQHIGPQD